MKPFLRWAGGKQRLAPAICPILRDAMASRNGRYVEPFFGGGAIFFELAETPLWQRGALLNDSNGELMRTYDAVTASSRAVKHGLRLLQEEQQNNGPVAFYAQLRDDWNVNGAPWTPYERTAARFIALNQTGFNGLYRVNKAGQLNVPIGWKLVKGKKTFLDVKVLDLEAHSLAMFGVALSNVDFRKIELRPGDVAYCDPPYLGQFANYTDTGFGLSDHQDLAAWARDGAAKGAVVAVSSSDVPAAREVYGAPSQRFGRADCIGVGSRRDVIELLFVYGGK